VFGGHATCEAFPVATICAAFEKYQKTYGIRRIRAAMAADGIHIGRHLIKKKMLKFGLVSKSVRRYKATTNSKQQLSVTPKQLEQNFRISAPNKVWVSDFTYL